MDMIEKLEGLAASADERAQGIHKDALRAKSLGDCPCHPGRDYTCIYHSLLNDFFYWTGKATAYRGIAGMLGIQKMVEDESDEESMCP